MDGRLFGDGCLLERGRLFEQIPFDCRRWKDLEVIEVELATLWFLMHH